MRRRVATWRSAVISGIPTIVLHGVTSGDAWLLWAERIDLYDDSAWKASTPEAAPVPSDETADTASAPVVVATMPRTISKHPFAASLVDLQDRLGPFLKDCEVKERDALQLRLPHRGGDGSRQPVPGLVLATQLALPVPNAEDLILGDTEVPCLEIDAATAVDLFTNIVEQPIENVMLGHDIRFWSEVSTFALELLADQRFVPSVIQVEGGPLRGRWVPWLSDAELAEPLRHLASAIPPVALSIVDVTMPDRWTVIESALESMIDALVRRTLLGEDYLDAIEDRDAEGDRQVALLTGLLGDDRHIRTSRETLVDVTRGARLWLGGLIDPVEGRAVRLCLQVAEPMDGVLDATPEDLQNARWPLGFHLLVTDDPPIIVDAADIWADGGGGRLASVVGSEETPGDLLLAELGRAERIWPKLKTVLEEIDPTGIELSTAESHAFLQEARPILQEAGIEVLAPSWWGSTTSRIGVRMIIEPHGDAEAPPAMGLSSLVDYSWEISIGDQNVGLEELRRLAENGAPLVRVGDTWVEIRAEDFERAKVFLDKHPGGAATLGEVLRLASIGEEDGEMPPITGVRTDGWITELLGDDGIPDDSARPVKVPANFNGTLRPYQERGLAWLAFLDRFGLGGCLADDMGLGKTIQMIALLQHEREIRPGAVNPTLLVCPMSVAGNWRRELERFAPELRVHVQHGPDRPVGVGFVEKSNACDVVVTTYALVSRDRPWIEEVTWERVVLDEAQHVKNPPTKQATAIRSIKSRHRIALTGTPVENRLTELWSIMEFCLPGFLGPQSDFRRRFAIPIERHRDERRAERLKQLVGPFILRRLKTDDGVADDLPPLVENRQQVQLTPEQAKLYDTVVQDMLRKVDEATGIRRRGLVLSGLVRLKQICNHPAHFLRETDLAPAKGERLSRRSGKSIRLVEILEEVVAAGDQALIFTQFRQMGHLLATIMRQEFDMDPLFLHGGTPQGKRDQMIERFQNREAAPIFILSLKAGGVGVNLTSANHVIHFDRWWNPAVENQATDRAFRIGQTRTVNVHKMITSGTLEERIDQMIEQKTDLARRIIGAGESWLTELSSNQLRNVLALRESGVEEDDS